MDGVELLGHRVHAAGAGLEDGGGVDRPATRSRTPAPPRPAARPGRGRRRTSCRRASLGGGASIACSPIGQRVAAGRLGVAADLGDRRRATWSSSPVDRAHPAVADRAGPAQRGRAPCRRSRAAAGRPAAAWAPWRWRRRRSARPRDSMRSSPQHARSSSIASSISRAASGEVLAERLVLGLLPADADAEPHPAARQRVERADLLGDEHRLALRAAPAPRSTASPAR